MLFMLLSVFMLTNYQSQSDLYKSDLSVCEHIERANRNKKIHLFCCRYSEYQLDDDRIGAMNLYRMGIEYLVSDTVTAE